MNNATYNLVNNEYGNHSEPMTVSEFEAMCRACGFEIPEMRETSRGIETWKAPKWATEDQYEECRLAGDGTWTLTLEAI